MLVPGGGDRFCRQVRDSEFLTVGAVICSAPRSDSGAAIPHRPLGVWDTTVRLFRSDAVAPEVEVVAARS